MAKPYLDILERLVSSVDLGARVGVCKHFFSGAALYVEGNICASLTPKGLAFKLPAHRCQDIIKKGAAIELRYFDSSPIKKGYILLPDFKNLSDTDLLSYFLECAEHVSSPDA
jgi:hypothetical protein